MASVNCICFSKGYRLIQKIRIGIDVASASEYIHHHCREPVLHCDVKPSNGLLDSDMISHVGDFGLLRRFLPEVSNPNQSSSVGVTIDYQLQCNLQEYGLGSEMSTNGDVYSYGILLEMVTRKKHTDHMFDGDFNLHSFARMELPDWVMDIVDPMLVNEEMAATVDRMRQGLNNQDECQISMVRWRWWIIELLF